MRALPTKGVRALDDLPPQLASQLLRAARELKALLLEQKDVGTQLRMVQDKVSVLQRLRSHSHLRVLSEIDKTFSEKGLDAAVLAEDAAHAAVSAEETETLSRAMAMPELTPDSSLADTLMQMASAWGERSSAFAPGAADIAFWLLRFSLLCEGARFSAMCVFVVLCARALLGVRVRERRAPC